MSAPNRKTDRMAWFKMDAGRFVTDTAGFSLKQSGAYIQLMTLYWIMGNCLPVEQASLMRRVGAVTPEDIEIVHEIIKEFFPLDADGKHCHALLDQQLSDVQDKSGSARAAALKRHGTAKQPAAPNTNTEDF